MSEALWHDIECGSYADDLEFWDQLATEHGGPVLDVGAGTGRVALHLARRGHDVDAVELEPELAKAMSERAAAEGLALGITTGDARTMTLQRAYPLVIAPMQLIQLLGGPEGRVQALGEIARALVPGGMAAIAIVEGSVEVGDGAPEILPDVREVDGYVHSSLPLGVQVEDARLVVHRLRQTVAPDGELTEAERFDHLDVLDAQVLIAEATLAELEPAGEIAVTESERYVGTSIVLLRKGA